MTDKSPEVKETKMKRFSNLASMMTKKVVSGVKKVYQETAQAMAAGTGTTKADLAILKRIYEKEYKTDQVLVVKEGPVHKLSSKVGSNATLASWKPRYALIIAPGMLFYFGEEADATKFKQCLLSQTTVDHLDSLCKASWRYCKLDDGDVCEHPDRVKLAEFKPSSDALRSSSMRRHHRNYCIKARGFERDNENMVTYFSAEPDNEDECQRWADAVQLCARFAQDTQMVHDIAAGKRAMPVAESNTQRIIRTTDYQQLDLGHTVAMHQGDKARLPTDLESIRVGLGWNVKSKKVDLDASIIVLDAKREHKKTVYYGDLSDVSRGIVHHGDNQHGGGADDRGDDEEITIDLRKAAQHPDDTLNVVVNIYSADATFEKDVHGAYVRLFSGESELARFELDGNVTTQGLFFCELRWKDEAWYLTAIGSGCQGKTGADPRTREFVQQWHGINK